SMTIDETAPVIEGIEDGETYCPSQIFTVSETNLGSVLINGEVQTAVDGNYVLMAGDDEQCTIVVMDKAGNSTAYTVTVSHTWASTTYAWSEDGKTCTATRICEGNPAHVETAEATVTGEQTKAPDCTEKGETTYTATFTDDWAETQTKTIADVGAAGHFYGDSWESDETNHWHACACGEKTDVAEHEFVWVTTKEAEIGVTGEKHEKCEICGFERASVEIPAMAKPDDEAEGPQTGDNSNIALWMTVLFVSGIVLGMLKVKRKKQVG
ncbi:MAG: sortase B protein-sorting domain-containing protein, partial [Bianqueaceae bacterium]